MNQAMQNNALPAESRREGQIELLRVVCMLLILAHHLAWHGSAIRSPNRVNQVLCTFLFAGGMTGVNCFVMITGYFLAPFKAKRFFATALQTVFYSVGLTLLAKYAGWRNDVTGETLQNAALIITRSPYWFVAMYLALTAVLPLLQPAVKALGKHAHLWVLVLSAIYLSVIPTMTLQNPSSQFFHQFTWFLFLYVLGAYFRKFPNRITRCVPLQGGLFLLMIALIALSCLWGNDHQELFQRVASRQNFFADKNTVPQLLASCGLFLFFANLRIKPYKGLTLLSGASFGVYLIHDHGLIRSMLWGNWLQIWAACQRPGFWPIALLAPIGIYLACAVLDLLRKYLLEMPLLKGLDPAFKKLDGWLAR